MQALLVPITHPQSDSIPVKGELLAIGRNEEPFDRMPADQVIQLSRRHARIFDEQGVLYLVDLGSRNGTLLNGRLLADQPQRLQHGDEIVFGNLAYWLQGDSDSTESEGHHCAADWQLALTPCSEGQSTIVIKDFPCLMSKNAGVLAEYCARSGAEDSCLSRRHAHVYVRKNALWLEDLGSTNGTWVNGKRLTSQAYSLFDGDRIRFGQSELLAFTATVITSLDEGDATEFLVEPTLIRPVQQTDADQTITSASSGGGAQIPAALNASAQGNPLERVSEAGPEVEQHTILLDKANTFLDIFCDVQEPDNVSEALPEADEQGDKRERPRKRSNWLSAFLLSEDSRRNRRALLIGLFATATVVAVAAGAYLIVNGNIENQARRLYEQGQYVPALELAGPGLEADPDNEGLRRLVLGASIEALVPPWQSALGLGDFGEAEAVVSSLPAGALSSSEVTQVVRLLLWSTDLERTVAELYQSETVDLFKNEARVRTVLQQWDENPQVNQHYLGLITQHVPEFQQQQSRLMSQLRKLQSSQSIYLSAIDTLKQSLDEALAKDQLEEAGQLLDDFERKYANVGGMEQIELDYALYGRMIQARDERQLLVLEQLRSGQIFDTPLFEAHAMRAIDAKLPSEEVLTRYQVSREAWLAGNLVEAISIANPLRSEAWGEVAERWLAHYERVIVDYDKLLATRGTDDYPATLLSFYGALEPELDRYFLEQLKPDLAPVTELIKSEIVADAQRADALWQQYQSNGGIDGILRLQSSVSRQFRERSAELGEAYALASGAAARSVWLNTGAEIAQATRHPIHTEVRQQRRALRELSNVLGKALVAEKLALLPEVRTLPSRE